MIDLDTYMSVRDLLCMTGHSRILYNKFSGKDLRIDLIESSIEYGVGGPEIAINLTERVKNNSYWKNVDVSNKTSVIKLEKWNSDVWFIKEIDFIDSETILNLKENMSKEYLYFMNIIIVLISLNIQRYSMSIKTFQILGRV